MAASYHVYGAPAILLLAVLFATATKTKPNHFTAMLIAVVLFVDAAAISSVFTVSPFFWPKCVHCVYIHRSLARINLPKSLNMRRLLLAYLRISHKILAAVRIRILYVCINTLTQSLVKSGRSNYSTHTAQHQW